MPLPSPDVIASWRADPVKCIEDIFRDPIGGGPVRLSAWQKKAFRLVRDHDRVSIRAGRGVGKTAFLIGCGFWRLLTFNPARNIFTSPRRAQMEMAAWPETGLWLKAMDPSLRGLFDLQRDRLIMKGVSDNWTAATTVGADKYEPLQGIHDQSLLWIVDEANGVGDNVFEVAMGSLTTKGAKVLLTGNPRTPSGFFYRTHTKRGMAGWKTMKVSAYDVKDEPYFSQKWLEDQRSDWGEKSWQWAAYVLGEFPAAHQGACIPLHLVMEAADREAVVRDGHFPIWGYDPAAGGDRCSLAKRHANVLQEVVSWVEPDTEVSNDRIVEHYWAADPKPSAIVIELDGQGQHVFNALRRRELPVVGVRVSSPARKDETYVNVRAEMWHNMASWFSDPTCSIPDDDDLIEEFVAPTLEMTSENTMNGGRLFIESREKIIGKIGRSVDEATAVALTMCAGSREKDARYLRDKIEADRRLRPIRTISAGGSWISSIHLH